MKREGGASPSGEQLAMLKSQMVQILADNWALREQDKNHSQLIAIETRLASMGARVATPGPLRIVSEKLRNLKRRRIVEHSIKEEEEKEEEEVEKEGKGAEVEEKEEGKAPALKKAKMAASEKGKEKEV
ncbi:hypothetical protein F5879DRAFT_994636 [Lentinula edodes]|nr:hypothetical protein F5879DRAFT_994636 [Lentinula edodes]